MQTWWSSLTPKEKKNKAKQVPANKSYLDQISTHHAVPSIAMAVRLTEVSGEQIQFGTWRAYSKVKK
ncbi:hypothetical protein [Hydromonas duriensis]|uniref:Uncharacterized protein n=1 Tax=Hydromonas duriensis TaxID=1527608 RepID=A0A4R6Y6K2_9BURK|nr:hypothetical protein [Hydromonas duriensis]TDR30661.1 hypothetical protein DFR44_1188 [Hydromonas duriensis]